MKILKASRDGKKVNQKQKINSPKMRFKLASEISTTKWMLGKDGAKPTEYRGENDYEA